MAADNTHATWVELHEAAMRRYAAAAVDASNKWRAVNAELTAKWRADGISDLEISRAKDVNLSLAAAYGEYTYNSNRAQMHAAVLQGAAAARSLLAADGEAARLRAERDHYRHLALTDELTAALNRRGLAEHWATIDPDAVLGVIDLNRFNEVNNTWGHDAGDAVLVSVAALLGEHGTVARLGGDELAVVAAEAGPSVLTWQVTLPAGQVITVAGAAGWVRVGPDMRETLTRADLAMYQAKHGRNPGTRAGRRRVRDAVRAGAR
ncbi:GGDEF domain-containing protein [Micromonospora carbonacea]|uniref:Diguanylate cyclase (GGDEF) domain-containing protein n=1 Tax=Micromonospora carbonacea TaxID=47853 RepID=A0A1C4WWH8_9ACTN|nr:diguanylate cyclase (GGDEF) domain-containing protein [Micromonospora carbonacea]